VPAHRRQSAFEIAQERLLLEACRQLTYLPAAVASIAYELGFQDPAYFSRLFKKRFGLTVCKLFITQGSIPSAGGCGHASSTA
jgi:AraC-like DNA-binding protein